jgi:hypothetical protein
MERCQLDVRATVDGESGAGEILSREVTGDLVPQH